MLRLRRLSGAKVSRPCLGTRPVRFRKPRLLIVGCGDIGLRIVEGLGRLKSTGSHHQSVESNPTSTPRRLIIRALTSSPHKVTDLRSLGVTPLLGNLDHARSLKRLAGIATHILHLAPPAATEGEVRDLRTRRLAQALLRARGPKPVLVYGSTSAVYGNTNGAKVTESSPVKARMPRALRRIDAEQTLRQYGKMAKARVVVMRIPGIYAPNREGGTPRNRLLKGLPVLQRNDDVYTSHIHADDLARGLCLALWRGASQRSYNINDDTELLMGDYIDLAADLYGLPRPPRVNRQEASTLLSPMQLSFMQDSRRLSNARLKQELRLRLRYPTVSTGLLSG